MWPDFIPWEEPREVVIHQENPNSADIGLVCTAIQVRLCFFITNRVFLLVYLLDIKKVDYHRSHIIEYM